MAECGNLDGLDPRNELRSWLELNNFILYGPTRGRDYTHTFLNGGTALIPDDKHDIFLTMMAEELTQNKKWSVHEQATRYARLYFDFDIEELLLCRGKKKKKNVADTDSEEEDSVDADAENELEPIPNAKIREWVLLVQRAVLEFFPEARMHSSRDPEKTNAVGGRVIVLSAPTGYTKRARTAVTKTAVTIESKKRKLSAVAEKMAAAQQVDTGVRPNQAEIMSKLSSDTQRKETVTMRKTGLHLVFPNIVCDLNQMLDVRAHVVSMLETEFNPPGEAPWSKVVDEQVYNNSCGLRMPGTWKIVTCKECKGGAKKRLTCRACDGKPREWVERPYRPLMVLSTSGSSQSTVLRALKESNERLLKFCSIRQPYAYETRPPFVVPPKAREWTGARVEYLLPVPDRNNTSWANAKLRTVLGSKRKHALDGSGRKEEVAAKKTKRGGASATKKEKEEEGEEEKINVGGTQGDVIAHYGPEHEIAKMLTQFIRRHTYPCWSEIDVVDVRQIMFAPNARFKQSSCVYFVKVSGSQHCLNLGAEHRSAKIYFFVTKDGVEQRCYCRCANTSDRVARVSCAEFRSNTCEFMQHALGRQIIERLFPATATINSSAETSMMGLDSVVSVVSSSAPAFPASSAPATTSSSYPSLADVRRDTEHKLNKKTKKKEQPLLRRTTLSRASFSVSASSIMPGSDVPDFDEKAGSIEELLQKKENADEETTENAETEGLRERGEDTTYVVFPGLGAPRDMEHYKQMAKESQKQINALARYQADMFLQR